MNHKNLIASLLAGLLAGGLFIVVFGLGLGFLFMFLPTLPIFSIGLSRHPRLALAALAAAFVLIAAVADPASAILFAVFLGFPAWYIVSQSLMSRQTLDGTHWMPVGLVFFHLTIYACMIVAAIVLFYYGQPGGIPAMLAKTIRAQLADLKDDYSDVIDTLATQWSFLVFSITVWLWGLALYGHAWLAHRTLAAKHLALRPDLKIRVFHIPSWMLSLMGISALASLIGSPSISFLGKSSLISLLLPYFFLGLALLHAMSRKWPSRRFILFFIYFAVFTQFWPALIVAGLALWHQLSMLNKHLSSGGKSSKH